MIKYILNDTKKSKLLITTILTALFSFFIGKKWNAFAMNA